MLKVQAPIEETERRGEQRIPMSYEEFLAMDGEHQHAEWEDGVTIIFMPATPRHQDIVTFLATLIRLFSEFFQLGRVYTAPVEMKVSPTSNAREPDLLFVVNEHLGWIDEKRLAGPADLAVEVISPESVSRDQKRKKQEYEAAGVKEYWVLDSRTRTQQTEFWVLDANGRYQAGQVDADGIYRSTVLKGFWLDVAWLRATELPDPQFTFAHIAGFPPAMIETLRQIAARGPLQQ